MFQPFEQRNADRTGLGLGLAISRLGAEANNGRIYARNLPDHGCIFTIDLPRVAFSLSATRQPGCRTSGIGSTRQTCSEGHRQRSPSHARLQVGDNMDTTTLLIVLVVLLLLGGGGFSFYRRRV